MHEHWRWKTYHVGCGLVALYDCIIDSLSTLSLSQFALLDAWAV